MQSKFEILYLEIIRRMCCATALEFFDRIGIGRGEKGGKEGQLYWNAGWKLPDEHVEALVPPGHFESVSPLQCEAHLPVLVRSLSLVIS